MSNLEAEKLDLAMSIHEANESKLPNYLRLMGTTSSFIVSSFNAYGLETQLAQIQESIKSEIEKDRNLYSSVIKTKIMRGATSGQHEDYILREPTLSEILENDKNGFYPLLDNAALEQQIEPWLKGYIFNANWQIKPVIIGNSGNEYSLSDYSLIPNRGLGKICMNSISGAQSRPFEEEQMKTIWSDLVQEFTSNQNTRTK